MQPRSITVHCIQFKLDEYPHLKELTLLSPPAYPLHKAHPPLLPPYLTVEGHVCV